MSERQDTYFRTQTKVKGGVELRRILSAGAFPYGVWLVKTIACIVLKTPFVSQLSGTVLAGGDSKGETRWSHHSGA